MKTEPAQRTITRDYFCQPLKYTTFATIDDCQMKRIQKKHTQQLVVASFHRQCVHITSHHKLHAEKKKKYKNFGDYKFSHSPWSWHDFSSWLFFCSYSRIWFVLRELFRCECRFIRTVYINNGGI